MAMEDAGPLFAFFPEVLLWFSAKSNLAKAESTARHDNVC